MEWMLMPLRRYADFQGRSRRREYWMYTLFVILLYLAAGVIFVAIAGGAIAAAAAAGADPSAVGLGGLMALGGTAVVMIMMIGLMWLVLFIPSLAVAFRRLHDIGRSGWWAVVPTGLSLAGVFAALESITSSILTGTSLIASLVLLVFFVIEGNSGPNRFGPDPKGMAEDLSTVFS